MAEGWVAAGIRKTQHVQTELTSTSVIVSNDDACLISKHFWPKLVASRSQLGLQNVYHTCWPELPEHCFPLNSAFSPWLLPVCCEEFFFYVAYPDGTLEREKWLHGEVCANSSRQNIPIFRHFLALRAFLHYNPWSRYEKHASTLLLYIRTLVGCAQQTTQNCLARLPWGNSFHQIFFTSHKQGTRLSTYSNRAFATTGDIPKYGQPLLET